MIKKVLLFTMLNCLVFSFAFSQNEMASTDSPNVIELSSASTTLETSDEDDYERLLDAYLTVEFREYAYEELELTSEQIIALDPIYMAYMDQKDQLFDRRAELVREYREEMKEDDRVQDEINESADFVEDYWDSKIAADELRKDYFDRMEDVIPYQKALRFFMLEENVEARIFLEQPVLYYPLTFEIKKPRSNSAATEESSTATIMEIDRYNIWMQANDVDLSGKVGLDHSYTYDGLEHLTKAIQATVDRVEGEVPNLDERLTSVMANAEKMTQDPYADTHADLAREAFLMLTDVMTDVQKLDGTVVTSKYISNMRNAAEKIDVDVLYMDQSAHAYNFFQAAQKAVNGTYTMDTAKTGEEEMNNNASSRK